MAASRYPKKAKTDFVGGTSWWYETNGGIEIYLHLSGLQPRKITIPRRQLVKYLERTQKC